MSEPPHRLASRPLKVLVLGVGGNVSQGIQKALALTSHEVAAACIDPTSAGLYLAEQSFISPLAADPAFAPWLLDLAEREEFDAVLSGSEPVLSALADLAAELRARSGTVAIVSPPSVLAVGHDKLNTCQFLEQRGLPCPAYARGDDEDGLERLLALCELPLVAKPRSGKGSEDVRLIRDRCALEELDGRMLVQEQLGTPEGEYTAGCLCDSDGQLKSTVVMKRTLRSGTTAIAQVVDDPDVSGVAGQIVEALRPLGPCNVQLRMTERGPVPFELNVRFSGTTPLRARLGINEVDAALRHFVLDEPMAPSAAACAGHVLRYWNEIYVPTLGHLEEPRAGVRVEDWGMTP